MTHLFLFTLGPVQGFIAQARKTRDLYAGSRLLSDLVREGIKSFEEGGGKVIFPHGKSPSQPNRFLGQIDGNNLAPSISLNELGKQVEAAVKEEWKTIAYKVIKGLTPPDGFDQQIDQALETFWVFHPASDSAYHKAYRDIERVLGAIKNLRPVRQYHYQQENGITIFGERGRKCSLDGERNALFYRKSKVNSDQASVPAMLRHNKLPPECDVTSKFDDAVWRNGEALSGVSTVKRLHDFEKEVEYPSTSEIALANVIQSFPEQVEHLKTAFGKENLGVLIQQCNELSININNGEWVSWNDQYYYEENLNPNNIPNHFQLELARKRLKKLTAALGKKEMPRYYALLHFDGDNMGQWLSGANLAEGYNRGAELLKFHEDLAEQLARFSYHPSEIEEEMGAFQFLIPPKGRTIYAGGDDFLGFVNLEHLFDVLGWLRERFDEYVNQKIAHKKQEENFTFSAGLVIAHYKTPLHVVLDWTRSTEKAAKNFIHPHGQRKDTLGISVLKASGEITQAFAPWFLEKYDWNTEATEPKLEKGRLQICTKALKEVVESLSDNFSDKWLRILDREFFLMKTRKKGELELRYGAPGEEMVKAEMRRLLKRACMKKECDEKVKELLPSLYSLLGPNAADNFGNFSNLLHICDFIERKTSGLKGNADHSTNKKETNHG